MWLTYLDESGNTGRRLDDPAQPYHVIVGISVREDVVSALATHIDELMERCLGTNVRTKGTELHASQLRSGNGPWRAVAPDVRIEVYRAALQPLAWDGVLVSHASIDKLAFGDRQLASGSRSPHLWALQFLIEKLNAFFSSLGERTLLVADETNEHQQFALDLLVDLQTGRPRPGLYLGQMTQIVDTVHFVRSETNRGVQLADLVAYLLGRGLRTSWGSEVEKRLWLECVASNRCTWRSTWP